MKVVDAEYEASEYCRGCSVLFVGYQSALLLRINYRYDRGQIDTISKKEEKMKM